MIQPQWEYACAVCHKDRLLLPSTMTIRIKLEAVLPVVL